MKITYKTIDRFPGYRFGSDGSIWSERSPQCVRSGAWRRLKVQSRFVGRHLRVEVMIRDATGKQRNRRVGSYILEAFVGPCPPGLECLHKDGDQSNNVPSNLRWGTHQENAQDSLVHGTFPRGERGGSAKLTTQDVLTIRDMSAAGRNNHEIASVFHINPATVSRITRGKKWTHVGGSIRTTDRRAATMNKHLHIRRVCKCGRTFKGPSYYRHLKKHPDHRTAT